jgi:hypothetical protein
VRVDAFGALCRGLSRQDAKEDAKEDAKDAKRSFDPHGSLGALGVLLGVLA